MESALSTWGTRIYFLGEFCLTNTERLVNRVFWLVNVDGVWTTAGTGRTLSDDMDRVAFHLSTLSCKLGLQRLRAPWVVFCRRT